MSPAKTRRPDRSACSITYRCRSAAPRSLTNSSFPLKQPADLEHYVLLHDTYAAPVKPYADWESWLAAAGLPDLRPAGSLYFSQHDQVLQAAIQGQGVALGITSLVQELIRSGVLIAPFDTSVSASRACFIVRSALGAEKPQVDAFVRWIREEVAHDAQSERAGPAQRAAGGPAD